MKYLIIILLFLNCTTHTYYVKKGTVTDSLEGAVSLSRITGEHDTCWYVKTEVEEYTIRDDTIKNIYYIIKCK